MPKGRAATPLKGPIVKGTGKALIAKAGGGRKALRTWRSLTKPVRKSIIGDASKPYSAGSQILDYLGDVRERRILRGQRAATGKDMPGFKANVRQLKGLAAKKKADYAPQAAKDREMAGAYKTRMQKTGRVPKAPAKTSPAKAKEGRTMADAYKARMKKMGKI